MLFRPQCVKFEYSNKYDWCFIWKFRLLLAAILSRPSCVNCDSAMSSLEPSNWFVPRDFLVDSRYDYCLVRSTCRVASTLHDVVIKWKHFPRYLPGDRWISPTRSVTRNFDVFFDLRLSKWLRKHSRRWWFDMPSRSIWRHCKFQPFLW